MTLAPAAAASTLREHVLINDWTVFVIAEAVREQLRAEKLAALVLRLHAHAHFDADGAATYDMRRAVTTCCISCGPITEGRWCPTVSGIAGRLKIDLDQRITELGRKDAIERLAAQHCARLKHSHPGSPRCDGYRAAVAEHDSAWTTK